MIELIPVPFDLCGRAVGSRLGPTAMSLCGMESALRAVAGAVSERSPVVELDTAVIDDPQTRRELAAQTYKAVSAEVEATLRFGSIPVMVGGDHSLSMGSISGALRVHGKRLGVLWIDAHADLNTPCTSPSGNVHGMPLAALARLPGSDEPWWDAWLEEIIPDPGLQGPQIGWLGLRDVDLGERSNMKLLPGCCPMTMEDVDRQGAGEALGRILINMAAHGVDCLWVSFDVDSLDPLFAPGTGTAVRGGLTYREGQFLAEELHRRTLSPDSALRLVGVDVVEVNPLRDRNNETATVAVEWLASLFGKRILG